MSVSPISKLPPVPAIADIESIRSVNPSGSSRRSNEFGELLEKNLKSESPLSFSTHANARLESRNIQLTAHQMSRLNSGVEQAAKKGSRDSLVMLDNLAFIVSVANRKVITAVDSQQSQENVYTKIDSAVIV